VVRLNGELVASDPMTRAEAGAVRERVLSELDGWKSSPEVPVPEAIGPASMTYCGFYLANGAVLIPRFDDPRDAEAFDLIAGCFPDRKAVPVDGEVVGGAIHHLALGEPVGDHLAT